MDLNHYFPKNYTPTVQQVDTLRKIEHAFDKSDVVILSAPTGTGKSFVAKTLGNASNKISNLLHEKITDYSAFDIDHHGQYVNQLEPDYHGTTVLTITKALQDQYIKLFGCASLKGKSNYISTLDSQMDVEIESAVIPRKILHEHRTNNRCNYYNDRNDLLTGQFSVTNYKMYLNLPDHVKHRQYLVCDEASELEDELVSQCSCTIDYDIARKVGIKINKLTTSEPVGVYTWLDDLSQQLQEQRIYLQKTLQKKKNWSAKNQTRYRYINSLHSKVTVCLNSYYECEYVVEKNLSRVLLTPLYVDSLTSNILKHAKKTLLMSATIIDHEKFAGSLGIKKYEYVQIDSTFNSKKSPIYVSNKYPLSRQTMSRNLPKITANIAKILEHHSDVKGVIHTHTHEITHKVCDILESPRLIYRQPGISNEKILEQHQTSDEPTVLVSPSLTYGIDLKDSLARFQIIVKLPYMPLQDKRIKKLFDIDPEWYENKMLNTLVQSCGRATRGANDYSVTYILDGLITKVVTRCKHKLPQHFIDRFV